MAKAKDLTLKAKVKAMASRTPTLKITG